MMAVTKLREMFPTVGGYEWDVIDIADVMRYTGMHGTTNAWYLWYEQGFGGAWWTWLPYQSQSEFGCVYANHTLTD